MSITIELEPKKEAQISQRAAARGVDASTYAQRLLDEALEREDERERQAQHEKNQRAIAWLQSRIDEANAMTDEEKAQAEAEWRDTARSIDENRTSYRKLFPEYSEPAQNAEPNE
jgi:hypothetical protein